MQRPGNSKTRYRFEQRREEILADIPGRKEYDARYQRWFCQGKDIVSTVLYGLHNTSIHFRISRECKPRPIAFYGPFYVSRAQEPFLFSADHKSSDYKAPNHGEN